MSTVACGELIGYACGKLNCRTIYIVVHGVSILVGIENPGNGGLDVELPCFCRAEVEIEIQTCF